MAHDVLIAGALFPDVPSVQFPDSQQQWHSFTDVSDTTAAAADVAQGKVFYDAAGVLTQGTASGGGGGAPKIGVLRPDAELWKTYTYDKMIVEDEGVTIPAYNTSAQTLKARENLEAVALDMTSYDYEVVVRTLAKPTYNVSTHGAGKHVYTSLVGVYECYELPSGAMSDSGASCGKAAIVKSLTGQACLYWYTANQLEAIVNTNYYGCYATPVAPSLSDTTLTIRSPDLIMRGYSSIYSSTYWNATTDVRYQYIIELYRTPKSNQYFDGYSLKSLVMHAIACAQSATGKLT